MKDIAEMNQRITILENKTVIDEIGNHTATFENIFSCWASVSVKTSTENTDAGTTKEVQTLEFTIRQSSQTKCLSTSIHRIAFQNVIYDIQSITPSFRLKNYIKLTVEARKAGQNDQY